MSPRTSRNRKLPPRPKSLDIGSAVSVRGPSGESIPLDHLERIEQLDDVIFAALRGDANALDESARLYRRAAREAPAELLEESREQYLERAESIVKRYTREPGKELPRTFAALEILTLVAEE